MEVNIGEQRELRLASSSVRIILDVAGYLSRKFKLCISLSRPRTEVICACRKLRFFKRKMSLKLEVGPYSLSR